MLLNREEFLRVLKAASSTLGDNAKDYSTYGFRISKFKKHLFIRCSNRHAFSHVFLTHDAFAHEEDFDVLVSGKSFLGFLSEIRDEDFNLTFKENDLRIKTKGRNVKFPVSSPSEIGFPTFPSLPKDDTNLKGSFEVSSLYKGLNFVKNYTKDASSSPTETIIELRSCNILGGSSYGLAIWKDPSLVGAFLLKAHVVKKLILFMKEAGCEKVSFYSDGQYSFFKMENGWAFMSLEMNVVKRLPKLETSFEGQEFSAEAVVSKSEITSEIKVLKHTLDDKVTDVTLLLKGGGEPSCEISFTNSQGKKSTSVVPCKEVSWVAKEESFSLDYKTFVEILKTYDSDDLKFEFYPHLNNLRILEVQESGIIAESMVALRY